MLAVRDAKRRPNGRRLTRTGALYALAVRDQARRRNSSRRARPVATSYRFAGGSPGAETGWLAGGWSLAGG